MLDELGRRMIIRDSEKFEHFVEMDKKDVKHIEDIFKELVNASESNKES